jgi:hypothetical protein
MNQIEALPSKERWEILEQTRHLREPDVPEEFREGMAAIARGEVVVSMTSCLNYAGNEVSLQGGQAFSPGSRKAFSRKIPLRG